MTNVKRLIPATCEYCRFSRVRQTGLRQCRLWAPQIAGNSVFEPMNARWTVVEDTDWCGEYEPVERAPPPPVNSRIEVPE